MVDTATVASNKITTAMMQADSVTRAKINADAVGVDEVDQTADINVGSISTLDGGVYLIETTAPSVGASTGALYTKDTSGQPELFFREESDGDEVQITSGGSAAGFINTVSQAVGTSDITTTSTSYEDMTDMSLTVGAGKFLITLTCPITRDDGGSTGVAIAIEIDSVVKTFTTRNQPNGDSTYPCPSTVQWYEDISGAGVIKGQWKTLTGGTGGQGGATYGNRVLTALKVAA